MFAQIALDLACAIAFTTDCFDGDALPLFQMENYFEAVYGGSPYCLTLTSTGKIFR
jgi:hypothetical protein